MPKVSRESAQVDDHGIVEDRHQDIDGGYTVNFVTFRQEADATPLLKGLPDDRCQAAHWGYVFKGRITYGFGDHEEVVEAGDAFYVPAGHTQRADAGTEILQFSPSAELHQVSETITKNLQAMMQGA